MYIITYIWIFRPQSSNIIIYVTSLKVGAPHDSPRTIYEHAFGVNLQQSDSNSLIVK